MIFSDIYRRNLSTHFTNMFSCLYYKSHTFQNRLKNGVKHHKTTLLTSEFERNVERIDGKSVFDGDGVIVCWREAGVLSESASESAICWRERIFFISHSNYSKIIKIVMIYCYYNN